jgi:uncharacterized protein
MSGGALKLRDVRKLADSRAAFEFEMPVAELPDVPPEFGSGDGQVQAQVRFGREQGFAVADVSLHAHLQVICQRCMAPMPLTLEAHSPVLVVESEREAEEAPAGWETFLAPEGRLNLAALVAEELLLAVPIVPLHEPSAACAAAESVTAGTVAQRAGAQAAPGDASGVTRPFADLKALLERGGDASNK